MSCKYTQFQAVVSYPIITATPEYRTDGIRQPVYGYVLSNDGTYQLNVKYPQSKIEDNAHNVLPQRFRNNYYFGFDGNLRLLRLSTLTIPFVTTKSYFIRFEKPVERLLADCGRS
jgi:hypothetical protein